MPSFEIGAEAQVSLASETLHQSGSSEPKAIQVVCSHTLCSPLRSFSTIISFRVSFFSVLILSAPVRSFTVSLDPPHELLSKPPGTRAILIDGGHDFPLRADPPLPSQ